MATSGADLNSNYKLYYVVNKLGKREEREVTQTSEFTKLQLWLQESFPLKGYTYHRMRTRLLGLDNNWDSSPLRWLIRELMWRRQKAIHQSCF
jgi:hypothetical protein